MKIEDLHYDFKPKKDIPDERNFDVKKWREENPVDYLFFLCFLLQIKQPEIEDEIFKAIYKITRLYRPEYVYKYYSLNEDEVLNKAKFETLREEKIYTSNVKDFNDPFDSKAFFYNPSELISYGNLKEYDGELFNFSSYIRTVCFTTNGVQSMPMWAHYSNNHKGFCVKYSVKANPQINDFIFPVQYCDERIDVTSLIKKNLNELEKSVETNIRNGIYTTIYNDLIIVYMAVLLSNIKHRTWEYENEYRCSISSGDQYIDAKPEAIYVGKNCSIEHYHELENIAHQLNVPFYRMEYDDTSEKFELVDIRC